jgi:hypothetical protein
VRQLRQIRAAGFLADQDFVAHFGLGDATKVEVLRIEWPSGIVRELTDVPANQCLTITETQNLEPEDAVPQETSYGMENEE